MIEKRRLKNVVIFIQTILSIVQSKKCPLQLRTPDKNAQVMKIMFPKANPEGLGGLKYMEIQR